MVLYFSGTGNSQLVAIQIAEKVADNEIISINQYLKTGRKIAVRSKRPLVFVTPTYAWRIPKVVKQWIMKTRFEGNLDTYFLLTCGDSSGNAAVYAEMLCRKKGLHFCGLSSIVMPENYLALFPTPSESECQTIMENAKLCIAALAEQIQSGTHFIKPSVSLVEKLKSGPVNLLFYTFFVRDKGFRVSASCISCGKCVYRCPLNNIELINGKPVWKGNCTHCMACIGGCPVKAIEYKSKSQGRRRHYIMNDALCWNTTEHIEENIVYTD